jgi:hypothetical protein
MDIICFVHILIRNGSADGLLLAKRGQKPTSVLFFAGSGECRRALYNKLRFQKQQHHAAYQYTPQEYAESLAIPDELYQQLQKSHRMSVHFTSQGQIKMVVSEKALVRA